MTQPWLIRMHHWMRSASFAMLFVATGLHVAGTDFSLAGWVLLAVLFLIYPQLQYRWVRRLDDPVRAEMHSLTVDSLLLGIFVAAVGFSQWLAFTAILGTLSNSAANKGREGILQAVLAVLGGAGLWIAIMGFSFSPHTEWSATILCMVGLAAYLLAMSNFSFLRNSRLRQTRETLELRKQELLSANLDLRQSLEEIDQLQVKLREQATHDPLTKLFNRGYLDSTLEREMARCRRDGVPLSVAMIDVDHFKSYNDCYGHPAGDTCLKRVADALQGSARRATDLVARYGGEEFSLVLPNTDSGAAQQMAEAARQAVEALAIPHEQSSAGRVTISIGVTTMANGPENSVEALMRLADQALYQAKHDGRNQVRVAQDAPPAAGGAGINLENPVQLVWKEAHACASGLIDDQHRALFSHANNLLGLILAGRPANEVSEMLDALIQEVSGHFQDEEAIILASGLAGAAEHVAAHQQLVNRAIAMREGLQSGTVDIGALFQFVAHELIVQHMLGADKELLRQLEPQA
jgi:diguanylate cyclase (GGDEF)-like protein/hemerythrin-like metal-binding protein